VVALSILVGFGCEGFRSLWACWVSLLATLVVPVFLVLLSFQVLFGFCECFFFCFLYTSCMLGGMPMLFIKLL
jgi:hypothetical protein